jgi:hypothetical protein
MVVTVIFVGLIAVTVIFSGTPDSGELPMSIMAGIFFAFLLMFFVISIQRGLVSGDAIFEMSDVNLLFVSPIKSQSILIYGLVKLAKTSFLASVFILFQGGTLSSFGIDFGGLLILFVVFICAMIIFSFVSLVIYSVTNGKPVRKHIVKVIASLIFLPLIIQFVINFMSIGDTMMSVLATLNSTAFQCTPILGWATAGTFALIQGKTMSALLWLGLTLISGIVLFVYLMLSRSDFYEDVLVATETAFEKKRAAKEGDIQTAIAGRAKTKVRGIGLGGRGATVFLYKHLRETFRKDRFGFLSIGTLIMFAVIIILSLTGTEFADTVTILQILMWIQLFMIGMGRGLIELYSHYIFMIPESSFKKIVWSNIETVINTFIESVLYFFIPGIITGTNVTVILFAMLTYTLFTMLLIGINYLSMRWTQTNVSNGIFLIIYIIAIIIVIAPGAVVALVLGSMIGGTVGIVTGLAILSAWEVLTSLICFGLAKGVLDNCDMPTANKYGK